MIVREYFPDHELRCHCGCGLLPPVDSVERLYALRILIHVPLELSSAARCKKQNRVCRGKAGSIHLPPDLRAGVSREWRGGAFDIIANADLQIQIISAGLICGFNGYGIAETYIHIDDAVRVKKTLWKYKCT